MHSAYQVVVIPAIGFPAFPQKGPTAAAHLSPTSFPQSKRRTEPCRLALTPTNPSSLRKSAGPSLAFLWVVSVALVFVDAVLVAVVIADAAAVAAAVVFVYL